MPLINENGVHVLIDSCSVSAEAGTDSIYIPAGHYEIKILIPAEGVPPGSGVILRRRDQV